MVDISIIIVNWNVKKYLSQCIDSVKKNSEGLNYEIIVVDNYSTDGSIELLKHEHPDVAVIENKDNRGFSYANNQGIAKSKGAYILLLNPDTVVLPGLLHAMKEHFEAHPETGVVGPKLIDPNDPKKPFSVQWLAFPGLINELLTDTIFDKIARLLTHKVYLDDTTTPIETDWVSGSCMMVRKKAIDQAGLMNTDFFLYMDEVEWCYRIKKLHHWRVALLPYVNVIHYGGQSTSRIETPDKLVIYYKSRYIFFRKYKNLFLLSLTRICKALLLSLNILHYWGRLLAGDNKNGIHERLNTHYKIMRVILDL